MKRERKNLTKKVTKSKTREACQIGQLQIDLFCVHRCSNIARAAIFAVVQFVPLLKVILPICSKKNNTKSFVKRTPLNLDSLISQYNLKSMQMIQSKKCSFANDALRSNICTDSQETVCLPVLDAFDM